MNRAEKATLQLRAVAVLRALKQTRTYDELATVTELPAGDLNRYVNGHVLPGIERARRVVADVGQAALTEEIRSRISVDPDGYVDNSAVVFDQRLLNLIAPVAAEAGDFDRPAVVLTAATDGITLAAAMASHFDARAVYAKQSKETAVEQFIESRKRLASGIELTYYLPTTAIDAGETVLVVDDLIRSGGTQMLLLDIAERADATIGGVFALIAAGTNGIRRVRDRTDAPVQAMTTVEP